MYSERDRYQIAGHEAVWITAPRHEPRHCVLRNEESLPPKAREINTNHYRAFPRYTLPDATQQNHQRKDIYHEQGAEGLLSLCAVTQLREQPRPNESH